MSEDRPLTRSISVLDSALIVAMFSAVCYVMGHAARIGIAQRLGVPFILMPDVGAEAVILIGGVYLVLVCAIGLFIYFACILVSRRTRFLRAMDPVLSGIQLRARQHPYVYLLLALLAGAAIIYSVPLLLPFTPRSAGGSRTLGGRYQSDVVTLRLKEPDSALVGRALRYLWRDAGIVLLQDKGSEELVLIKEDEIRLMILTRTH